MTLCPALLCCCDEKPKPPPGYSNNPPPQHLHFGKPTTQEIVSAVRDPEQLGVWPLTLDLPHRLWNIKVPSATFSGPSLSIEGSAPHGDIQIQISSFPNAFPSLSVLDQTVDDARKKQAAHPQDVLLVDFRALDPAKVFEEREIHHVATAPSTQSAAADTNDLDMVNWTLTVVLPHRNSIGKQNPYDTYLLSFIGLSRRQYEQDREFLEQILGSLKYRPAELNGNYK
jgi:hypothetical protein